MNLVIVESPAKAKTINKYLGPDFEVLASYGHVRDLPAKDGSVQPDDDFAMTYEVDEDSKKQVALIAKAAKRSDHLYLATDPDREGEAISWHVLEALKAQKALPKDIKVQRIVFHEITKKAVLHAVAHPRDIDMDLVNAQQARRALDYLVGFTLSPLLWRKLPGSRSAGRVQSVALRLICERDAEIETFKTQEYWDIRALLGTAKNAQVKARLTQWQGKKLEKLSISNEAQATEIVTGLKQKDFAVSTVEPKTIRRNPYAPFTTSTLQQEAARKLGFSAKKTMQLAQKLYEGVSVNGETIGLITYMRTDGVTVSADAIADARNLISKRFGKEYVPDSQRMYKAKSKNAQEAHEAVRPTDVTLTPDTVQKSLDNDMWRLYDLIWKRMMASQMEQAVYDQVSIEFTASDKLAVLRASGSVMKFDGFMALYQEGKDDAEDEDGENARLPALVVGEKVSLDDILPEQHFTEPPPRFTEASLVKKLEELGIGRPSTYASIISVLQDRNYVRLDKKRFTAEMLGHLVNAFLTSFFDRYVQYDFTADLENRLDEVSAGNDDWKKLLREFWKDFILKIEEGKNLTITEVLNKVDEILEPFIFRNAKNVTEARVCPQCKTGRLGLKTGKFGSFLGCSNYPECNFTRQLSTGEDDQAGDNDKIEATGPKILGKDPTTGLDVTLKKGPYGFYVETGEGKKPKRASLLKTMAADEVTLDQALGLLALPRDVGMHPESGKMIVASTGRFGPYLLHDGKYTSLRGDDDPLTVGINRAVTLIAEKGKGAGRSATPLRTIGEHPEDKAPVEIFSGQYGPYVKHGKINASLSKGMEVDAVTMEQAVELLNARIASGGKKSFRKGGMKKAAAKPAAKAKPATGKKPEASKTAAVEKKPAAKPKARVSK